GPRSLRFCPLHDTPGPVMRESSYVRRVAILLLPLAACSVEGEGDGELDYVESLKPVVQTVTLQPSSKDLSLGLSCQADSSGNGDSLVLTKAEVACFGFDSLIDFDLAPLAGVSANSLRSAHLELYQHAATTNYGKP